MYRSLGHHRDGATGPWGLAVPLAGLLILAAGGCQTYERKPVKLAEHHAAFLERTPESAEVRAFAEKLAAREAERASVPSGTFDPKNGIDCTEAEVIALVFNADLRIARLRAGVTEADAANAGLWEDPTIGVDIARIIESTPEPWKVFTSVGITLPISGRLEIEKQRAHAEHGAELARVAQQEWAVRMDVRRAWHARAALETQVVATRAFLDRVDQILVVVDKMEKAGEMARTEGRLFRIERATKSSELAFLESRTHESDLLLRQLMGLSPDAALQFASTGFPLAASHDVQTELSELTERSPALLVAMAEYDAAEIAMELAIRKQYPDLQIGPGYGRDNGKDQALLAVSVPIPLLNANKREIAEARAKREVARAHVEATLERSVTAVRSAEIRLAATVRRRAMLRDEIVPLVDAQYTDAREVARLGEVNSLVLLESLARQHEAKVGLIEAARDEALAAIDLEELIGPAISHTPSSVHAPTVMTHTSDADR